MGKVEIYPRVSELSHSQETVVRMAEFYLKLLLHSHCPKILGEELGGQSI